MMQLAESQKMQALHDLQVLDTPPESALERLVLVASKICGTPISLISLVDERRQWFKAVVGLDDVSETPREHAFCAHAILEDEVFEIPDATSDPRFVDNPLVTGAPHIRYYAGVPLILEQGARVGTLCIIDTVPRAPLPEEKRDILRNLAAIASAWLEREPLELVSSQRPPSGEAMATLDDSGKIRSWNTAAERLTGLEAAQVIGSMPTALAGCSDPAALGVSLKRVLTEGIGSRFDAQCRSAVGGPVEMSVGLTPIASSGGAVVGAIMLMRSRDVQRSIDELRSVRSTSLERALAKFQEVPEPRSPSRQSTKILIVDDDPSSVHLLHSTLSEYPDVRFATDGEQGLAVAREWNPDLVLLDGELPGLSGLEVCRHFKEDDSLKDTAVLFVTAHDNLSFEEQAVAAGAADFLPKPINAMRVRLRVALHLELQARYRSARESSRTDDLTGISNRRVFRERILSDCERCKRALTPITALIVDVDYFKRLNDTYGHAAGDECLRRVATSISTSLLRPSDLVARIGGEEFAVLLPETDFDGATVVAERIRAAVEALQEPNRSSEVLPHVTVSIGGTSWSPVSEGSWRPPGGRPLSADLLLETADRALYTAKSEGRNRAVHFRLGR